MAHAYCACHTLENGTDTQGIDKGWCATTDVESHQLVLVKTSELKVKLVHEIGRSFVDRIPGIGDAWSFFKGQVFYVELTGPLAKPDVDGRPLGLLSDPIFELRDLLRGDDDEGPRSKPLLEE